MAKIPTTFATPADAAGDLQGRARCFASAVRNSQGRDSIVGVLYEHARTSLVTQLLTESEISYSSLRLFNRAGRVHHYR
jgi:hypothetical protein